MEKETEKEPAEKINLKRATLEDIDAILEVEKSVIGTKLYSGLTGSEDAVKEMADNIYYLIEILSLSKDRN